MRSPFTVVIPAYNEGDAIVEPLRAVLDEVGPADEVLVVYDSPDDTTAAPVANLSASDNRARGVVNTYGRGPANAIRYGIDVAAHPIVVVTMGDASDDPKDIPTLAQLVADGAAVAAGSRYSPGGGQTGGPAIKRLMSRLAGWSLHRFAGVPTLDATNNFKAYSKAFVQHVGIEAERGFEIGLELTSKAKREGLTISEIPTHWHDRSAGESNFRMAWIPLYLRWWINAFRGPTKSTQREEATAK